MEANNTFYKRLAILFLSLALLCACQKTKSYNLSKELTTFGLTFKVDESIEFIDGYKSGDFKEYHTEDNKVRISIQKFTYTNNIPDFKEMSEKFVSDFNKNEENIVIKSSNSEVIIIDKKLNNSSKEYEDKDYSIDGLYLNDNAYYYILYYGDYDSMLENKDWIIESLKTVSFNS